MSVAIQKMTMNLCWDLFNFYVGIFWLLRANWHFKKSSNEVLYVLFLLDPQNNLIIIILQVKKVKISKVIMTYPSHAFNWILLSTNPLLFTYIFYWKGANTALSKDFVYLHFLHLIFRLRFNHKLLNLAYFC